MKILGIETSCDDTAAALVDAKRGHFTIIRELRSSQIDIHKKYGGVVPEVAARAHAELIMPLVAEVLAGGRPDVIAVTAGPGLITALMVGVQTAASLAYAWRKPLVAVNHIEGHIYGNWLGGSRIPDRPGPALARPVRDPSAVRDDRAKIKFPALALVVSGGHTELILMRDHGKYQLIGKTRDDAAGECFDKVGKLLGFDYPGGPKISERADNGDQNAIRFPRPMINSKDFDFSFAGLKTAALYWVREHKRYSVADFCASFEQAIVDVLVSKTIRAAKEYRPRSVLLGGGVAANKKLRSALAETVSTHCPEVSLTVPPLFATVDNAPMIAVAGYFHARRKDFTPWKKITANPNWRIA